MKVLIISANFLPASPSGPAYIAGAALEAGHDVEVFEVLFADDLSGELKTQLDRFAPEVVALSIRLAHGFILDENAQYGTRHLDLRIKVKDIVDCIKQNSLAHIVLGGPGFNYYGLDWLEYLELDYGIRGEADKTFPMYLKTLETGGDLHAIPGSVYRSNGRIKKSPRAVVDNLDSTAMPAYQLFDLESYYQKGISPAITTKRGCVFHCTYCPYASLEGKKYRLKSPQRVVDEIEHIYRIKAPNMVSFCDNNFNVPNRHALAICREIIDRKLEIAWGTGSVKPLKLSKETLQIFKQSGCAYLSLSVETASEKMLKKTQRGVRVDDIEESLTNLSRSDIPFSVGLMFGLPGETPETIAETLEVIDAFKIPNGVWVTIGICLWTPRQIILRDARADGQLAEGASLFEVNNYVSPALTKSYMEGLLESLQEKENYAVQVNQLYAEHQR